MSQVVTNLSLARSSGSTDLVHFRQKDAVFGLPDIYIDAPCDRNRIHVTMNGVSGINSNLRCRTNLMVDRKEIMNL
ncbi:MAG: hypothetical protein RBR05_05250, partial [Candidatus Methanomethylophilaceae archaeon]|nr:hypothetical protein [Candidatus Methanomethylophilaceae archaeon]